MYQEYFLPYLGAMDESLLLSTDVLSSIVLDCKRSRRDQSKNKQQDKEIDFILSNYVDEDEHNIATRNKFIQELCKEGLNVESGYLSQVSIHTVKSRI